MKFFFVQFLFLAFWTVLWITERPTWVQIHLLGPIWAHVQSMVWPTLTRHVPLSPSLPPFLHGLPSPSPTPYPGPPLPRPSPAPALAASPRIHHDRSLQDRQFPGLVNQFDQKASNHIRPEVWRLSRCKDCGNSGVC